MRRLLGPAAPEGGMESGFHRVEVEDPMTGRICLYAMEPTYDSALGCFSRTFTRYRAATANGSPFAISSVVDLCFEVRRAVSGDVIAVYRLRSG